MSGSKATRRKRRPCVGPAGTAGGPARERLSCAITSLCAQDTIESIRTA